MKIQKDHKKKADCVERKNIKIQVVLLKQKEEERVKIFIDEQFNKRGVCAPKR